MNKDYTKYKAHQLLNDDYFLESILHPTTQDHQFWQQLQDENESFKQEMQIAHSFLKNIKPPQRPAEPPGSPVKQS